MEIITVVKNNENDNRLSVFETNGDYKQVSK